MPNAQRIERYLELLERYLQEEDDDISEHILGIMESTQPLGTNEIILAVVRILGNYTTLSTMNEFDNNTNKKLDRLDAELNEMLSDHETSKSPHYGHINLNYEDVLKLRRANDRGEYVNNNVKPFMENQEHHNIKLYISVAISLFIGVISLLYHIF